MQSIHRPSAATTSGFILETAQSRQTCGSVEEAYIVVSYDIDNLTWIRFIWVLGESTDDHLIERVRKLVLSYKIEAPESTLTAVRSTYMFFTDRSKDGLMVQWLVGTEFDVKELYMLFTEINNSLLVSQYSCLGGL